MESTMENMRRRHGIPAIVLTCIAAMSLFGCSVKEYCYLDSDCDPPMVCGPEGFCVYRCITDDDCGEGFVCRDHECKPSPVQPDTGPDGDQDVVVFECPQDMVMVAGAFCIDRYEASRPDATDLWKGTDDSMALSRKGVIPWQVIDNSTAQAACEAAGKSLCSPARWELACKGSDETVYGYGDEYQPETCNGLDTFGLPGLHLETTGAFPDCTNEWGVFDMNGNLWEHVLGGSDKTIRGGAYNCKDSMTLHRCDYIPKNWTPSERGFRCCMDPQPVGPPPDEVEPVPDTSPDVFEVEVPGCIGEDVEPTDTVPVDPGQPDPGKTDTGIDDTPADEAGSQEACPADMVLIDIGPPAVPYCMDRFEASHENATDTLKGDSPVAASQQGVLPWYPVTLQAARDACDAAGKRLCTPDEWFDACVGTSQTVYVYGDEYLPEVCNGIDSFCFCDSEACLGAPECPYPHCYKQTTPNGEWGPCGANVHVTPTGDFTECVNQWGVHDINGNAWEIVDTDDGEEHFRGGAYNCGNSEALHRCDHDGTWGPSVRGFRCCRDAVP